MLAVLKISAAYVPLDVGFPTDRMAYIVADARVRHGAVAVARAPDASMARELGAAGAELVCVDEAAG